MLHPDRMDVTDRIGLKVRAGDQVMIADPDVYLYGLVGKVEGQTGAELVVAIPGRPSPLLYYGSEVEITR